MKVVQDGVTDTVNSRNTEEIIHIVYSTCAPLSHCSPHTYTCMCTCEYSRTHAHVLLPLGKGECTCSIHQESAEGNRCKRV